MILFNNQRILQVKYKHILILFIFIHCTNYVFSAPFHGLLSHEMNSDSTITFTYIDSTAHRVELESPCLLPGDDHSFAGRHVRRSMHQVQPAIWQLTTPRALAPELYTFRLLVNGKAIIDLPTYEQLWKRNKRKYILLIEGSTQSDLYAMSDSPGQLDTITFMGDSGNQFYAITYLPYNYNDTIAYPVLYLLHGINGNQYDWVGQGRINHILDNLIQQEQLEPIIVVMPYCLLSRPKNIEHVKATNVGNYGEILSGKFEQHFHEISAYVQSHYSTSASGHGIAGLSCGARQAANIAHLYPNTFSYVGLFSPVVSSKQLPDANTEIHYWVGACTDDWMFYNNAKHYVKGLRKRGIQPIYVEKSGGHTFTNWRKFATEFLKWAYPNNTNTELETKNL